VIDRRDPARRAEFVRTVLTQVVHNPAREVTTQTVQRLLNSSPEVATRILQRLREAGLFEERARGVWARVIPAPPFLSGSM
jgi:DNA-binding IscR family transcriptional regulator